MIDMVDCRKCANCDLEHDCCKKFGNDPEVAAKMCAERNFGNYQPVREVPDEDS